MAKGRRAQPAEVKAAKGNPGRRPIAEPQDPKATEADSLPPIASAAPEYLKSKPREVWQRLAPEVRA